jgi:hypothetical protein
MVSRHNSLALRQQKRRWGTIILIVVSLLATSFVFTLATLPSHSHHLSWGRPTPVPVPQVRGSDEEVLINAISCTSGSACSAGGSISTSKTTDALVLDESKGHWERAETIRGTSSSQHVDNATIEALSCSSPGNCSAGGSFINGAGLTRSELLGGQGPTTAFVVDEVHGKWGRAHALAGVVAPANEEGATISYLSCPTNGNCAAAGTFASVPCADGDNDCVLAGATYKRQFERSFVVNEVRGVWGSPQWLRNANRGEYPNLTGLSCGAPGTCAAVGTSQQGGFVANEVKGHWESSVLFPGSSLPGQTSSMISAVSCGSRGDCSAGGSYTDNLGHTHPFLVDEISGTWQRAAAIKGAHRPALNQYAQIQTISCGSASHCTAFGESLGPRGAGLFFFVLNKRSNAWSSVRLEPVSNAFAFRGFSGSDMACSAGTSCTIAGSYFTLDSATRPYALSEEGGRFTRLTSLKGIPRQNLAPTSGNIVALSCGAKDNCVIVEQFAALDFLGLFLVHETPR